MILRTILTIILCSILIDSIAQNEEDALRYSEEMIGGTARNMSMAGSMSALGGDFSVVLQNPAGLARFNKGNFSFSPTFESSKIITSFGGTHTKKADYNLTISNLSYLKSYQLTKNDNWINLQMGAGYNRTQYFNEDFKYSGNSNSSIIDNFIYEADQINEESISEFYPYSSGLAFLTYGIDPIINDDGSTSYTSSKSGIANHKRSVYSEGGMGEYNFTISGNYKNKIYLGGSLNIVDLNYYSNFSHIETFDENSFLNQLTYTGFLNAEGRGVNVRIGAIYNLNDFFRFGIALETPTRLKIHEEYGNDMVIDDDISINKLTDIDAPTGSFDYILRTPLKTNLSLSYIYKKIGSISASVKLIDYSSSKLKPSNKQHFDIFNFQFINYSSDYSFTNENSQISNLYKIGYNIKVGGEIRLTSQLYLRGGFAQFESAYKSEKNILYSPVQYYTGGIGVNFGLIYIDYAMIVKNQQHNYYAYNPSINGSESHINKEKTQHVITLGIRF